MAEQQQGEAPQMTPEMFKNTQEIAAQAALRAQQIMFRKSINAPPLASTNETNGKQQQQKVPPEIPARGDKPKIPPEVPPKRLSLKKHITSEEIAAAGPKQPPPLPQKPASANSSAQNSPQPAPKFKDKSKMPIQRQPLNLRPTNAPGTPQMQMKFQKPQPKQTAIARVAPSQQIQSSPPPPPPVAVSKTSSTRTTPTSAKKQMSPLEDFSSEDALRGIESGLRNMERAMAEQMTLRSLELAKHEKLNALEFKQNLRALAASATSLDGSNQNIQFIESFRMNIVKNMRSMERGFSMDQMRLENLGGMRTMESNPNMKGFMDMNSSSNGRPVENHMKSLDRNLPLELQYSRHHHNHHRSQSQQEMVEQLRQSAVAMMGRGNNAAGTGSNSASGGSGISREDLRFRRRSSHDENQMSQANNPGNDDNVDTLKVVYFLSFCCFFYDLSTFVDMTDFLKGISTNRYHFWIKNVL